MMTLKNKSMKFFKNIYLCSMLYALCSICAHAQSLPPATITMFATSADWEAITGMRMSEYRVTFGRDRSVSTIGTELYFLDAFPCFGQAEAARAWVAPATSFQMDNDARMRIVCVYPPKELQFAFREVRRDAVQGVTTGIAVCPAAHSGRNLTVRLNECERTDWNDIK
ncbi:MAG: hypothetical protein FWG39_00530 [Alphaproteobacteria bacterium]|nr:hypothetical protein [Alphaproteobacteria bacterium]